MENSKEQNKNRQQGSEMEGNRDSISTDNMINENQNASDNSGGLANLNEDVLRATGVSGRGDSGSSGTTTKRNVTGSDYDGQVSGS